MESGTHLSCGGSRCLFTRTVRDKEGGRPILSLSGINPTWDSLREIRSILVGKKHPYSASEFEFENEVGRVQSPPRGLWEKSRIPVS